MPLSLPLSLQAELTYVSGELRRGLSVVVDQGRIQSVGPVSSNQPGGEVLKLPRRVLLPGMVSAHSHAFQRLLRGTTEWRAAGRDDFWVWRERMYELAERLSPEALEEVCALTFLEMLRAGITTVGEFHYLHRDPQGRSYADRNQLAQRVTAAAERVGMRIVLLNTFYARGGASRPLTAAQRRFESGSVDDFLSDTEQLERASKGHPLVHIGIAPHSVRAVERSQLAELAGSAAKQSWPVHMHLSEQPAEVEACLAETGLRPIELAAEAGLLSPRFCAVHAVHVAPAEIQLLARAQASVCACPTTERDLGDGVVPADAFHRAGVRLSLGTDSNVQIDLLEEARSLEQNLRLLRRERILLEAEADQPNRLARSLFEAATSGGSTALGLGPAEIAAGRAADLIALDLDDPSLGARDQDLLGALVFGGQTRAVRDVMVGGRFVVRDGVHAEANLVLERFARVAASIRG